MEATMTKPKTKKPDPLYNIKQQLFASMGRPADLNQVSIQNVYNNKYRVNVFRNVDGHPRLTNSYFLSCDESGKILSASPEILKIYGSSQG